MELENFTAVEENYILINQQISDHPNFDKGQIIREVVIDDVQLTPANNYNRGLHIKYYINHYNKFILDTSFIKTTDNWVITDNQLITERDLLTMIPITNPKYELAKEERILGPVLDNPNYVSDEDLLLIPKMIKNPDYISDTETPDVINFITNPEYTKAYENNKIGLTIPNINYLTDDEFKKLSPYKQSPAFSYLLPILKNKPALLYILLSFYISEQDNDKFFDKYIKK